MLAGTGVLLACVVLSETALGPSGVAQTERQKGTGTLASTVSTLSTSSTSTSSTLGSLPLRIERLTAPQVWCEPCLYHLCGEKAMLKISILETPSQCRLVVEGKLIAPVDR
jgi:hypothetical protein